MRFHFLVCLLFTSLLLVKCFDPKDDFSEFDSPEDFDAAPPASKPQQQQKSDTVTKPPRDEVNHKVSKQKI